MQPEEPGEDEFINMNEESGCDENEIVPEEVAMSEDFTLKEFWEILHNLEGTMDEVVEAGANLEEKNMTVHYDMEKMLALYCNYTMRRRKQFKVPLVSFYK